MAASRGFGAGDLVVTSRVCSNAGAASRTSPGPHLCPWCAIGPIEDGAAAIGIQVVKNAGNNGTAGQIGSACGWCLVRPERFELPTF